MLSKLTEEVSNSLWVDDQDYAKRNAALIKMGLTPPHVIKTGTTIVGLKFKNGVVIGADSRATSGNIVADKYCVKLHQLSDRIYASGAGTAADIHQVQRMIQAEMTLLELDTDRPPFVMNAVGHAKKHLFKYMGYIGAYLIIGGVDSEGAHLFNIHAGGSALQHSFIADGSGSLAANAILEKEYRLEMERDEAVGLASRALMAGMANDLNSGNTYTYCVITEKGSEIKLGIVPEFCQAPKQASVYEAKPGPGSTLVALSGKIDNESGYLFPKNRLTIKKKGDEDSDISTEHMEVSTSA